MKTVVSNSKHASRRAINRRGILSGGSLALAVALIFASPRTSTSEPSFSPNNLPFRNSSGFHADVQYPGISKFEE